MKIVLINAPYETNLKLAALPLGVAYLASCARKAGHDIELLDLNASPEKESSLCDLVRDADLAGISGMITAYRKIKELGLLIKSIRPDIPLIIGGTAASSASDLIMENTPADFLCVGEGEITLPELAGALQKDKNAEPVNGIYFRADDGIRRTSPRDLISDLDTIPFPAWDLFDMNFYIHKPIIFRTGARSINIISSRGCMYRCEYCYRNFGRKVRYRSAGNLLEEIYELMDRWEISHFEFQDELFTARESFVTEFCKKVSASGRLFTWRCLGRVNMVNIDMLRRMKKAGCVSIGFGMESGSPDMLLRMNKKNTLDDMVRAVILAREAGIHVTGTFMVGFPGETEKTIKKTIMFCRRTRIGNKLFFTVPFPGTELFEKLVAAGKLKLNEDFLLKIGGDLTDLHINMTDLTDSTLVRLKNEAEKQILDFQEKGARTVNPVELVLYYFQLLSDHLRYAGFRSAFRRFISLAGKAARRNAGAPAAQEK